MNKNKSNAFTLIELMIVVIIIGILASIAIPAYQNFVYEAKISESSIELDTIQTDQTAYYLESMVNSGGGYQAPSYYNVNDPQPSVIPVQTKAIGTFSGTGWKAIRFGPTDPLFFQYNCTASGTGSGSIMVGSASADLKVSGGTYTVRTTVGTVVNDNPTWSGLIKLNSE